MNLRWNEKEDQSLKFLRDQQKIQDWQEIARILNENFTQRTRTPHQCKLRYRRHAQYEGKAQEKCQWSHKQDLMLLHFFLQHGCKWSSIAYHFPNKTQNNIKNRFYSNLRKCARRINKKQKQSRQFQQNQMNSGLIMNIVQIAVKVQQLDPKSTQKIEKLIQISEFKKLLFSYAFNPQSFSNDEATQIIKKLRKLNGVFKFKKRKNWRINEEGLTYIQEVYRKNDDVKIEGQ